MTKKLPSDEEDGAPDVLERGDFAPLPGATTERFSSDETDSAAIV